MTVRIDLIGPVPPPYGGVSVHLERLTDRLRTSGYEVCLHTPQRAEENIFDAYYRLWRESRGDVLHFHVMSPWDKWMIGVLAALGRPVVFTVHGESLERQLTSASVIGRLALRWAMRRMNAVIAVNPRIRDVVIREAGVRPSRVHHIPAFLPPDPIAVRRESPGPDVEQFLRIHPIALAANAFHLREQQGAPLYGTDMVVELLARLRSTYDGVGAIVHLATLPGDDQALLDSLYARAHELGVGDHLLVVVGSRPFAPTLARSSIMLRPTNTDGDAVSVREALWLGIPVVASDAVERPPAAGTFRSRDLSDFERAVCDVLDDPRAASRRLDAAPREDPFDALRSVYERVRSE